jgi:hypothetical protein
MPLSERLSPLPGPSGIILRPRAADNKSTRGNESGPPQHGRRGQEGQSTAAGREAVAATAGAVGGGGAGGRAGRVGGGAGGGKKVTFGNLLQPNPKDKPKGPGGGSKFLYGKRRNAQGGAKAQSGDESTANKVRWMLIRGTLII